MVRGVCLIRDTGTQRIVLRASLDLDSAIDRERFESQRGCHRDATLQADWRRVDRAGLRVDTIETLEPHPQADDDPREAPDSPSRLAMPTWVALGASTRPACRLVPQVAQALIPGSV